MKQKKKKNSNAVYSRKRNNRNLNLQQLSYITFAHCQPWVPTNIMATNSTNIANCLAIFLQVMGTTRLYMVDIGPTNNPDGLI
jgi:hypothetical protein